MRRVLALVLAMLGLAAVSACDPGSDEPATIVSATWEQHQAVEGFDSTPGETTDPDELARLADILDSNGEQGHDATFGESCDGGRTTDLSYTTDSGGEYEIRVQGCDRGDVGDAIDDLVSEWRTNG